MSVMVFLVANSHPTAFFSFAGEMMSDGSVSTAINPFSRRKKKFKQKNRYTRFGEDAS